MDGGSGRRGHRLVDGARHRCRLRRGGRRGKRSGNGNGRNGNGHGKSALKIALLAVAVLAAGVLLFRQVERFSGPTRQVWVANGNLFRRALLPAAGF